MRPEYRVSVKMSVDMWLLNTTVNERPVSVLSPGKRAVKWVCVCVVGQSTSNPAVTSTVAAHDYQDLENILVMSTPNPALASTVPAHGLDLENILVASTPDPALASTVAACDNLDLDNILVASWLRQHQFLLWLQL